MTLKIGEIQIQTKSDPVRDCHAPNCEFLKYLAPIKSEKFIPSFASITTDLLCCYSPRT